MSIKSMYGYFEVLDVSFSPKAIAEGEETNYSVTIKNVSGKKITSVNIRADMFYKKNDGIVSRSHTHYVYGKEGSVPG